MSFCPKCVSHTWHGHNGLALNEMPLADNLTIMHEKSVCLSAPSSAFPVVRSWTQTTAFESLGLRYGLHLDSHLDPRATWGGGSWVAGSSFLADSVKFVTRPIVLSFVMTSGEWRPLKGSSLLCSYYEFHSLCDMCWQLDQWRPLHVIMTTYHVGLMRTTPPKLLHAFISLVESMFDWSNGIDSLIKLVLSSFCCLLFSP